MILFLFPPSNPSLIYKSSYLWMGRWEEFSDEIYEVFSDEIYEVFSDELFVVISGNGSCNLT